MTEKKQKYRLEPLVRVKEKAKRDTEIKLAKSIKEVKEEEEKLRKLHEKKKEISQKRENVRIEMSDKIATGQAQVRESQLHLGFLMKLKEDEEALDKEIVDQEETLTRCKEKLKRARRDYMDAAYELNVMEKHREIWSKKQKKDALALEDKQMNELGNVVFQINKMR